MLDEFQAAAAHAALRKMFRGSHFSICTVDDVAKLVGVHLRGKDYQALQVLHCVHWSDMDQGMPQEVLDRTLQLLGAPALDLRELEESNDGRRSGLFSRLVKGLLPS